jgi:hypothetical protein
VAEEHDAAKEFLERFLQQLAVTEKTSREQNQLLRLQIAQNQQMLQAMTAISSQLDGLAQRSDYLYEQMGRLGHILMDDSAPPVAGEVGPYNDVAQNAARGIVDGIVQGIFPGHPGGSGRRRRP